MDRSGQDSVSCEGVTRDTVCIFKFVLTVGHFSQEIRISSSRPPDIRGAFSIFPILSVVTNRIVSRLFLFWGYPGPDSQVFLDTL